MPKKSEKPTEVVEEQEEQETEGTESTRILFVSPIANPIAGKKLSKKVLKIVKKAAKEKAVRRGVKEVVKAIRKKEKGLCILAADITPVDVIAHVPVLCEDNGITYCYVSSKEELGAASQTKRPTSCALINIKPTSELKSKFDDVITDVKALHV